MKFFGFLIKILNIISPNLKYIIKNSEVFALGRQFRNKIYFFWNFEIKKYNIDNITQ